MSFKISRAGRKLRVNPNEWQRHLEAVRTVLHKQQPDVFLCRWLKEQNVPASTAHVMYSVGEDGVGEL